MTFDVPNPNALMTIKEVAEPFKSILSNRKLHKIAEFKRGYIRYSHYNIIRLLLCSKVAVTSDKIITNEF